jgi:hypothetical protein
VKGPGIGQAVHLIAPSGATLSARVKDMSTTSFLLRLDLSETSDPFELVGDKRVSIEFTNQRGVCRIVGTAERAPGGAGLRVDATGTIELIQRRDYVRVEAFVPVTYHPDGPEGWVATAHTLDVSGNGLQITSAEGLLLGDMRRFSIELGEGEDDVHAVAAAVREAGEDSFGMRFVEIRERDRQRLVRWVFARERLARQIARHP